MGRHALAIGVKALALLLVVGLWLGYLLSTGSWDRAGAVSDVLSGVSTLGTTAIVFAGWGFSRILTLTPAPAPATAGPPVWSPAGPGGAAPTAVQSVECAPVAGPRQALARVLRRPGLTAGIMVVALALGAATVWQATRLHSRTEIARADAVAFRSQQEAGRDPALANLLAAEALRRERTPVTTAAAMSALSIPMHDSVSVTVGPAAVTALATSADGRFFAVPAQNYAVVLRDVATRRPVRTLTGHRAPVTALAFDARGDRLLSGDADGVVRLWDTASGKAVGGARLGHLSGVTVVGFVPRTGQVLSAGDDGTVRFWRAGSAAPDGEPIEVQAAEGVRSLAVSPDGSTMVTGGAAGRVRVWDLRHRALLRELRSTDREPVTAVAYAPDGRRFVTAGGNRDVRVWDGESPAPVRELRGHSLAVRAAAFSGDGSHLATAGDDATVRIWDLRRAPSTADVLTGHIGPVTAVTYAADGRILSAGKDGTVRLWAASATRVLGQPLSDPADPGPVNAVAFSPDGRTVVATGESGGVRFWDVGGLRPRGGPLDGGAGSGVAVAFAATGREVLTANEDGAVRVWDTATHHELRRIGPAPGRPKIWGMDVASDGSQVATSGDDGVVRLWDYASGRLRAELRGQGGAVQQVAFDHRGAMLASTSSDGSVMLWDLTQRPPVANRLRTGDQPLAWGVEFSPDDTLLAVASADRTVEFWDPAVRRSAGFALKGHSDAVDDVAFDAGGDLVATTSGDRTVRVWGTASREMIGGPLLGHASWVDGVDFSPAGDMLATTGDDGTVRLWDLEQSRWPAELCRRAARDLSRDEWLTYVDRHDAPDVPGTCSSRDA